MNENKRPLVSIMIITYNQEEFIAETIESCLSQTYENIEIIVGDDASKDRTPSILMEYKNKYPEKIKLFLNKKNVGITRNFNNILKECKGKYIAWLGGDDRFLPTKIEKQVKYLENNSDKIICYHSVRTFRNKTEETLGYMPRKDTSKYVDTDSLVREGCFLGGCSVMHRNIGLLCDEDIPIASDWLYWIELSYKGDLGYIDEVLSEYRRHEMNITQNTKLDTIYKEQLLTLQKVKAENLKDSNSLFI